MKRALRAVVGLALALFTLWLLACGMLLSALHAAAGLALLGGKPSRRRALARLVVWGGALFTVPLVGLPEYAATTNALHCRSLGFLGTRASADCDPEDVARGQAAAREGGPLFSRRERLAVHGFNHLLALGALLTGLPEVALETLRMSWSADPRPEGATTAQRRAQCRVADAALATPWRAEGDFPMRSPAVRRAIAEGLPRLGRAPGASRDLGAVHFVRASANNEGYLGALRRDSLRVALALEVPDSRLHLTRLEGGEVEVRWSGTMIYPPADIAFAWPLPGLRGTQVLRVSETVFCGMHADGAMNPYLMEWRWTLSGEDERLGPEQRGQARHGLLERLALALLQARGVPPGASKN